MENLTANFTTWIDLIKSLMTLFGEFPLNLLLVGSLFSMGFGMFIHAKHAAKA